MCVSLLRHVVLSINSGVHHAFQNFTSLVGFTGFELDRLSPSIGVMFRYPAQAGLCKCRHAHEHFPNNLNSLQYSSWVFPQKDCNFQFIFRYFLGINCWIVWGFLCDLSSTKSGDISGDVPQLSGLPHLRRDLRVLQGLGQRRQVGLLYSTNQPSQAETCTGPGGQRWRSSGYNHGNRCVDSCRYRFYRVSEIWIYNNI